MNALRQRITIHQPKTVVFYSFSYLPYWEAVVDAEMKPVLSGDMYIGHNTDRLYAVLKHPVATGVTNEYFHEAGRYIRLALAGKLKM